MKPSDAYGHACHASNADFFPFPENDKSTSHPEKAWKTGKASTNSGPETNGEKISSKHYSECPV